MKIDNILALLLFILCSAASAGCSLSEVPSREMTKYEEHYLNQRVYHLDECCDGLTGEMLELCVNVYGVKAKSNNEIALSFCESINPNSEFSYSRRFPESDLEEKRIACYSFLNEKHSDMIGNVEFANCIYDFYTTWWLGFYVY